MSEQGGQFEAVFRNDTANLAEIRAFVRERAAVLGFSVEELYHIELAVDEACANVMEHAYPPGMADPGLHLCVQVEYDRFTVVIADRGVAFDPHMIASPDMSEYMAEYKVGGLGIYLMRSLMDKVDYDIQPGIKNEVRLTKYLTTE